MSEVLTIIFSIYGRHPGLSPAFPELTDMYMVSKNLGVSVKLQSSIHINSNSENILPVSD